MRRVPDGFTDPKESDHEWAWRRFTEACESAAAYLDALAKAGR